MMICLWTQRNQSLVRQKAKPFILIPAAITQLQLAFSEPKWLISPTSRES
jgi:hypothetical protein